MADTSRKRMLAILLAILLAYGVAAVWHPFKTPVDVLHDRLTACDRLYALASRMHCWAVAHDEYERGK